MFYKERLLKVYKISFSIQIGKNIKYSYFLNHLVKINLYSDQSTLYLTWIKVYKSENWLRSGLEAARVRGRKEGRTRDFSKEAEKTAMLAQTLYNERKLGVNEIAVDLKISKMTLYKYLRHRGIQISSKI